MCVFSPTAKLVCRVVPHPGSNPVQIASLTDTVPILECGGLDTYIQSSGWKVGWVLVHDRQGVFAREVCTGVCVGDVEGVRICRVCVQGVYR